MQAVKLHLLITIICTQVAALLFNVPYFPIEISRTAASGPISSLVFRFGLFSLIVTLLLTGTLNNQTLLLWLSLSMIALFNDKSYFWIHMLGFGIMLALSTYQAITRPLSLRLLILALSLYLLRLVGKFMVLVLLEMPPCNRVDFLSKEYYLAVYHKHMHIMYFGVKSGLRHPRITMLIFKASAVLQWILLYVLSCIY